MGIGRQNQKELQVDDSWIPKTPFEPILPKLPVIHTDGQGNQLHQANWLGSDEFPPGFGPETGGDRVGACFNCTNCNWEVASVAKSDIASDSGETCTGFTIDDAVKWSNVPFVSLLALADAASVASTSAASPINKDLSHGSNPWSNGNYMQEPQYGLPIPHEPVYDNKSPPWRTRMRDALSTSTVCQFAPVTPDKAKRVGCEQDIETPYLCLDGRINQERNNQDNGIAATGVDADGVQTDKELQKQVMDPSFAGVPSLSNENDILYNEVGNAIDLIKTPQHKSRRKKHRPKVITESKPRPQKPVTPNLAASTENPTRKRKYVRKSTHNKASTPPEDATGESADLKTLERAASKDKTVKRRYVRKNALKTPPPDATGESIELKTFEPSAVKENPEGKRYVQKNALNKVSNPQAEATGESTDLGILEPAGTKENPKGNRNNVRKHTRNKASIPSAEATGEFTDPKTLEPVKKSCRRALDFDVEGQSIDEGSKFKPTSDLDPKRQAQDGGEGHQFKSTIHLGHGIEVMIENTQAGITYDLTPSVNQVIKDYISLPDNQAPKTAAAIQTNPPGKEGNTSSQESQTKEKYEVTAHNGQEKIPTTTLQTDIQLSQISTNCFNFNSTTLSANRQARGSQREHSSSIQQQNACSMNLIGIHYNALPAYQTVSWAQFPGIYKKRRTERAQNLTTPSASSFVTAVNDIVRLETCPQKDSERYLSTSKANHWNSAPHFNAHGLQSANREAGRCLEYKLQTFGCALSQTERSNEKISRGPRTRDLASLTRITGCTMQPTYSARQVPVNCSAQQLGNSDSSNTCIEALVAEMRATLTTKKRTKKRASLFNSASCITNQEQTQGKIILYNQNQFPDNSLGAHPEVIWRRLFSTDAIAEQLEHLDINRESSDIACKKQNTLVPYNIRNEQQNALVLYRSDGTIVPFDDSFEPIKKRRPRPKVDLDEETNKVWKLLMGNINSEGIDGTDEEKTRWWEQERKVFCGRADSFIARMHLVQGDRRFSQWKGSVVDSVIGVFLTQNVSDHLSSSAFMSLAAHFPLKSQTKCKPCYEERTGSVIEKPIVCILDPEDTRNEVSDQSICDQNSMTLHNPEIEEEREVVNSNIPSGSGTGIVSSGLKRNYEATGIAEAERLCYVGEERIAINDAVSSQNSVNSPIAQTAERKESFSENNSQTEDLTDGFKLKHLSVSTSFVELLQKAGSTMQHEVYSQGNSNVSSEQNSMDDCNKTHSVENDFQKQKMDNFNDPKSSLGVLNVLSNNCHLHLASKSGVLDVVSFETVTEETRYSDMSENKGKNSMMYHSAYRADSIDQITNQNNMTMCIREASRSPAANNPSCNNIQEDKQMTFQSQSRLVEDSKTVDKSLAQVQNNEMQQNLYLPDLSKIKENNEMNASTRKAKGRRVGYEIKDDVNWGALREQAESNGRKRERTTDTMDSLDWEAVRCADVNDIANTIKERGMNNVLARRIKEFLNRLVEEHGGIDLEWLRDVPPDKAKEYLLSIRGLGLKSVECVRLLTLHHLAFPVDTNVGRIAVRLGWVPLQPLPESLQLHLLELYPVLESIQRYLWPRLCKLDQRTLYELHYQMITFGKVFCTKSKPNCNACPMRGECRHFASAFASARLALPGPEEKGIVKATENRTTSKNPAVMTNQPLGLPQATEQLEENQQSQGNQQPEAICRVTNCEPIVEEPSSPEPGCMQVVENDIEDSFCEDPDDIPTIKLNIAEFTQNLQNYMQENMELQECDVSKALVALTAEAASIPVPKLKNVSRLRTEHQVYELPDSHPLLQGLDRREADDPCSYLLAIWTPGETVNSIQPPERKCNSQEYGELCDGKTCFSCNSIREANSHIVRGTFLIPCRTAMRGSFPLNGTYFQVNEVFADHDSSMNPIDVPRAWIWNLPRRTVYFGTSVPSIFKGLTTEDIQQCFWRGYVCVRGFDQKKRAPRPLIARLHFPASKLTKTKGKDVNEQ